MEIVTVADRPELIPIVAEWLWRAFWQAYGEERAATEAWVARSAATAGPQQSFVALVDGVPAGTATLSEHDLDERPELTPWLAGVFVLPEHRGRDIATALVRRVEAASRAAGVTLLWLYTTRAEGLYLRLGWERTELVERPDKPVAIVMRRTLEGDTARE